MSCHYSCSSCSSDTFIDLCLTCPVTRNLVAGQCLCETNFYEYQSEQCMNFDNLSYLDTILHVLLSICFYFCIALCWLFVLANLNHLYSTKARSLVLFSQLIALLLEYRYRFNHLTESSLDVLSAFNFSYMNDLICDK
jgi:hypothetical protein